MDKRAPLRDYYDKKSEQAKSEQQFLNRTTQLVALEDTIIRAFSTLIQFIDGKTTKTEVINQLQSISTPDVDKVVQAVSKLDNDILANKLDLKPITDALNGLKREVTLIPTKMPKAEAQRDSVKVDNLNEITLDTSALEKAIKALKLDPTIDVKAPVVNVDAPDLSSIKSVMLDVVKAINEQEYPEIPKTDLSKLERDSSKTVKQLEEANKHLKKIVEKPVGGGGGGGGHGTPYQDNTGKHVYVELVDGKVPVQSSVTDTQPVYDEGNNNALTRILEQATQPLWYDAVNNRLLVGSTVLSGTITTVSTVTAVTTVGGITNIGGIAATSVVPNMSGESWAVCVRNLLV